MTNRLAVFDCDGTLVDSQHNICTAMARAFEAVQLTPPERLAILAVVGLSLPVAMAPTQHTTARRASSSTMGKNS